NAWGLSHGPTTPWWVSDNGSGRTTLYTGAGARAPAGSPLVVTIPPPHGSTAGTTAAPTGNIFNGSNGFVVTDAVTGTSGPALFLFATENGTISGWSPTVNSHQAILAVDHSAGSAGAVYKGLALGSVGSSTYMYVANFRAGTVDIFDARFAPAHLAGAFTDPHSIAGFAPYNIANIGGQLYVAYAKQNAAKHDDVAGSGNGFVDVYSTSGQLIRRLVSGGPLNSPWGLVLAPEGFGQFSGDLLVGNFGDGRINAFDPHTGAFLGALQRAKGEAVVIPGLWGLAFGNGSAAGPTTTLFFAAGIDHEAHGLFGSLTP
ncbi:MAG TPA: TIGR03118 family protein, partial [Ktedonobacterales bacterium]|nr:TIGR03118 family protein [Ktedonobacterales bacterium]